MSVRKMGRMIALSLATATLMEVVSTQSAVAATLIQYSGDNITYNNFVGTVTVNGVEIRNLSLDENSPGVNGIAYIFSSAGRLEVTNSALSGIVYLKFGADGFNDPVAPPTITDTTSLGGNAAGAGAVGSLSLTSYVNATLGVLAGNQNGPLTVNFNQGPGSLPTTPDGVVNIAALAAPYAINQVYQIQMDSGQINFNSQTTLAVATVPEPATMSLFAIGAVGLGAYRLRRRTQTVG